MKSRGVGLQPLAPARLNLRISNGSSLECGVEWSPNYLQKLKVSGFPRSLEKHRRAKEGNREKEKDTTKREGRKKTQKSTTGNGPKETHKLLSEHSPQVGGKMQQSERNPAVSTPMFATK